MHMSVDAYLEALEEATGLGALIDHVGGPTEPAFLAVVLAAGLFLGLVLGPARLGMALMLVSSALCWSCILFWPTAYQPFGFLLPCCGFFWCWACKNRLLGPIWIDGGVFTFAPGAIAGALATMPGAPMHPTPWRGGFYVAATLLPALNFLVPVKYFATSQPRLAQISARYGKPAPFGAVFFCFCCSQFAFFPVAALHFGRACRLGVPAALAGLTLTLVLAAVCYKASGLVNAPILARQKTQRQKDAKTAA